MTFTLARCRRYTASILIFIAQGVVAAPAWSQFIGSLNHFGVLDNSTGLLRPEQPTWANDEFIARLARALVIAREIGILRLDEAASINNIFRPQEVQDAMRQQENSVECRTKGTGCHAAPPAERSAHTTGYGADLNISGIPPSQLPAFAKVLFDQGLSFPLLHDQPHVEPSPDTWLGESNQVARLTLWRQTQPRSTNINNLRRFVLAGRTLLGRYQPDRISTLDKDKRMRQFAALVARFEEELPEDERTAAGLIGQVMATLRELRSVAALKPTGTDTFEPSNALSLFNQIYKSAGPRGEYYRALYKPPRREPYWEARAITNTMGPAQTLLRTRNQSVDVVRAQIRFERQVREREVRELAVERFIKARSDSRYLSSQSSSSPIHRAPDVHLRFDEPDKIAIPQKILDKVEQKALKSVKEMKERYHEKSMHIDADAKARRGSKLYMDYVNERFWIE